MAETERVTGTVKWFNLEKGYGFIKPETGPDVFVHKSEVGEGRMLNEGDRVEFSIVEDPRGRKAVNVVRRVS